MSTIQDRRYEEVDVSPLWYDQLYSASPLPEPLHHQTLQYGKNLVRAEFERICDRQAEMFVDRLRLRAMTQRP